MRNSKNTAQTRVFSSSSSSSSRSHSSSSSCSVLPQTPRRTMDEVWRDVRFPPPRSPRSPPPPPPPIFLQHHNSNPTTNPNPSRSSFRGVIFQDFLAGQSKETPADPCANQNEFSLPLPLTALCLNSGLDFDRRADSCAHFVPPSDFSDTVIGSPQTGGLFSFCPSKRVLENSFSIDEGGDRRHKRMMKNRESAARSRARKQAYTNELELEVAHLAAENGKLKKEYEQLRLAMAAQHSTKKTLQRTLTAPF